MSAKLSHDLDDSGTDPGRRALLQRSLLGGMLAAGAALGLSGNAAAQSAAPAPSDPAQRTVRRVVTGNNAQGKSYFVKDETVKYGVLWTNKPDEVIGPGAPGDVKALLPTSAPRFDPPAGGAMLQFLAMQPTKKKRGEPLDKVLADGAPNKDGFHRTSTIDYIYVVNGEVDVVLDEGETTLHAGDLIIQRNTSHSWQNYGSVPATLFVVNVRV